MRKFINLVTESSSYAQYQAAAKADGNTQFMFSCPQYRLQAVRSFLAKMAEQHGVVFCDAESMIGSDFLIAGPAKILHPLERSLHSWVARQREGSIPEVQPQEPKSGLLHRLFH